MTVTINGIPRVLTEVELIEQAMKDAGVLILPRREWTAWHAQHRTPLSAILLAAGASPQRIAESRKCAMTTGRPSWTSRWSWR